MPALPEVLRSAMALAHAVPGIVAVGLVGSHARGDARPDSDVDLVVLTTAPELLLDASEWFAVFDPAAVLVRAGDFGAIQERRLRLADGTVVEVGVGRPSWATARPLDPGTRRVVTDGLKIVYDTDGILAETVRPSS